LGTGQEPLVAAAVCGPEARFRLLETTRAYAFENLTESGEIDQVERRHAGFYRDGFERAMIGRERRSSAEMLNI
jgi:predicted ATPase